jgi:hypothetical protein
MNLLVVSLGYLAAEPRYLRLPALPNVLRLQLINKVLRNGNTRSRHNNPVKKCFLWPSQNSVTVTHKDVMVSKGLQSCLHFYSEVANNFNCIDLVDQFR